MSTYGLDSGIFDWCPSDTFMPIWRLPIPGEDTDMEDQQPMQSMFPVDLQQPMQLEEEKRPQFHVQIEEPCEIEEDPMMISPRTRGSIDDHPSSPAVDVQQSEILTEDGLPRLEVSKSPIIEALVYCAFSGWGIDLLDDSSDDISFRVWDFTKYYEMSALICSKQRPTEDETSRVKALKRWFPDFPSSRERRRSDTPFIIHVRSSSANDNKPKKLRAIIDKTRELNGTSKQRSSR